MLASVHTHMHLVSILLCAAKVVVLLKGIQAGAIVHPSRVTVEDIKGSSPVRCSLLLPSFPSPTIVLVEDQPFSPRIQCGGGAMSRNSRATPFVKSVMIVMIVEIVEIVKSVKSWLLALV